MNSNFFYTSPFSNECLESRSFIVDNLSLQKDSFLILFGSVLDNAKLIDEIESLLNQTKQFHR